MINAKLFWMCSVCFSEYNIIESLLLYALSRACPHISHSGNSIPVHEPVLNLPVLTNSPLGCA